MDSPILTHQSFSHHSDWAHKIRELILQHLTPHHGDLICLIRESNLAIDFLHSVQTPNCQAEVDFIVTIYRSLISNWELIL